MYRLRFVPDKTAIQFMRGRIAGLVVSAVLSLASVVLFIYPGLNYGLDFKGGILIVDAPAEAKNHDYVVATQPKSHTLTFKQLAIDGSKKLLRPLNTRYSMDEVLPETKILGVIRGMSIDFR